MSRVANVKPETIAEASCIQNDATGPPTSIDRPIRSIDTPEAMAANAYTVKGRDGTEHPLTLHALPFFDPDKRIPRGLEIMEFKG